MYINNPKVLNLEGLENLNQKVVVGFRCMPQRKISLAKEADDQGITLSEHIERTVNGNNTNKIKPLEDELQIAKEQLRFYENKTLLNLFKKYEGQQFKFTSVAGDYIEVDINAPKDVYTLLINSFK